MVVIVMGLIAYGVEDPAAVSNFIDGCHPVVDEDCTIITLTRIHDVPKPRVVPEIG